ncbi:DASH family cryptochrome [Pseudomonas mangiferae]|uniref:Cryptochrome DASH n=1 Tax=Pseudomonas mangiferae TaxID=2593654 RepID=A0A553GYF1_9PSED|nr:DASH family cryptochrome [Pseudomonas mangiferae]TRX74523.1 DASH family cryptochrome [Pseudomonas mangiferae]
MRRLLLWFKQDLRLDDHPAVRAALEADRVLPVFILDPAWLQVTAFGTRALGVHRAGFLLESLQALDVELRRRGSNLLVLHGQAERLIPELVARLGLTGVVTLEEIVPDQRERVAAVQRALGGVPLQCLDDNGLLRAEELPWLPHRVPVVFSHFRAALEQRVQVFQPEPAPDRLPALPEGSEAWLQPLPVLAQLGLGEPVMIPNSGFPFAGGEAAAQARLRDYLWQGQGVQDYLVSQEHVSAETSSKLSPWLAHGCLSPRRVAADLRRYESQYGRSEATQGFWSALLWREFFRWTLRRHGNALFQPAGVKATARAPRNLDERYVRWCQGRTGMPLVDACMRELSATGYLTARARQVAASYLVIDLQQDWRHGAAWFAEHLIDHEEASNWGNWAFLAGVAADPRRRQGFNALRQARRFDPDAAYVSLWLPELRALPAALRHSPFQLSALQLDAMGYPRLERIPEAWQPYLSEAA